MVSRTSMPLTPTVDDAPSAPASRGATAPASRRTARSTSVKPSHTDLASALQGALGGAGAISGGGGERGGGGGRGFNGAQGSGSRRTTLVSLVPPEPPSIKEQHTWLHGLLSRPDAATALARWLPDEVREGGGFGGRGPVEVGWEEKGAIIRCKLCGPSKPLEVLGHKVAGRGGGGVAWWQDCCALTWLRVFYSH